MDKLKHKIGKQYSEKEKGVWKVDSDRIITPAVIRRIYANMQKEGYIPPPANDFVFVSPSANVPTHEIAFFEEDQKTRKGKNYFFVGDLFPRGVTRDHVRRESPNGSFQYFKWDAEQLPINAGSVDVLWDRKGWLWHVAKKKKTERFLATIDQYAELLKPGGCIVIDAIEGFEDMIKSLSGAQLMEIIILALLKKAGVPLRFHHVMPQGKRVHQYESSTADLLNRLKTREGLAAWKVLEDKFEIRSFGKGKERICVLRKKPSSGNHPISPSPTRSATS